MLSTAATVKSPFRIFGGQTASSAANYWQTPMAMSAVTSKRRSYEMHNPILNIELMRFVLRVTA